MELLSPPLPFLLCIRTFSQRPVRPSVRPHILSLTLPSIAAPDFFFLRPPCHPTPASLFHTQLSTGHAGDHGPSRRRGESHAIAAILHQVLFWAPTFSSTPSWRHTVTAENSAILKAGFLLYRGGKGKLPFHKFAGKQRASVFRGGGVTLWYRAHRWPWFTDNKSCEVLIAYNRCTSIMTGEQHRGFLAAPRF